MSGKIQRAAKLGLKEANNNTLGSVKKALSALGYGGLSGRNARRLAKKTSRGGKPEAAS
jgi:hypothetical protein